MGDTENLLFYSTGYPLVRTREVFDKSIFSFHPLCLMKLDPNGRNYIDVISM